MALTEDQKKQVISQINNGDFESAAETITGIGGDNDHNEALAEFLENMAEKGEAYISEKLLLVANIVEKNLQQKPNIFEDALYMALKDVQHPSETANIGEKQQNPNTDFDEKNMTLDEVDNTLNNLKSHQALLIRTNKPLDPEISKKIKALQGVRDKLYQENAANAQDNKPKNSSGWFNFASHSEISETLDYEVCQGTAVTRAIKNRMDSEINRGRIILSKQDSIKSSQIREFINLFVADMPDVTDSDEFVKESSDMFDNYTKIDGKMLENSQGIDHGSVFRIGKGWLVIIRQRQMDSTIPKHQFFVFDVDPSVYFTIKFHRRFKGGKIYPDAYTMLEFKGNQCISLVQSSKGENVIDAGQLQRIRTQVHGYQKTFEDLTSTIPSAKLKEPSQMSESEVVRKIKQEELKIEEDTSHSEDSDDVEEDNAEESDAGDNEVNSQKSVESDDIAEEEEIQVDSEIQGKIDNLQKLLQQAQINNQTSTIERLKKDIQELEEKKYVKTTGSASEPTLPAEDAREEVPKIEFDEKSIADAVDKMPYPQDKKDLISKTLNFAFDYDKIGVKEANKYLEDMFQHMHYEDLIRMRNKLTTNVKLVALLPYFDAYMTDYIELAYIAGDYKNKADKILTDSDKKSQQIVDEEQKISKQLEALNGKDLTAADLNKKISLQNRLEELEESGAQLTLDIERARIYLDADIEEIERLDHDPEHISSRKNLRPDSDAEKDKLIEKYKDKLQKVSEKLPALSSEEFKLSDEDIITDEQIEKFDVSKISAKSLADLAIAMGEPVDLADDKKAKSVLDTVNLVKIFDKYLGDFFKKIESHKKKIKHIKKSLEKTQSDIIEHERELELIKIANKVKLTPMIEERKLLEEKIANLENNQ